MMPLLRARPDDCLILHGGPGPIKSWAGSHPFLANAGMFDVTNGKPVGALVSLNNVINRYPTNWPLFIIDSSGKAIIRQSNTWKEYWDLDHCDHAVSCAPLLVWDGQATDFAKEVIPAGVNPGGKVGRTAIGIDAQGNVILAVEASATLAEMQQLLIAAGAVAAMNLDGGGSSILYRDGQRVIGEDVRKYPSAIAIAKEVEELATVCIDPGHGGRDPELKLPDGTLTKNINLAVGLKIADLLNKNGVNVVLTRKSDVDLSPPNAPYSEYRDLQARVDIANKSGVDYFVSIHVDSAESSSAEGATTYIFAEGGQAEQFAGKVQKHIATIGQQDRGVKVENFHVLRETDAPAILVEMGFGTNSSDKADLLSNEWQARIATAVANGILEQLGKPMITPDSPAINWQARALAAEERLRKIAEIASPGF